MIRKLIPLAMLTCLPMLATGCSQQPRVVTQIQTVDRAVPVSCVPSDTPPAPSYPDTDAALKAAQDGAERYVLLYAGHKLRAARGDLVEHIIAGCR